MFKIFVCYSFVGLFNVHECWPENCTVCMLGASRSQKRESEPLELTLQVDVSCRVLGTKPVSFY